MVLTILEEQNLFLLDTLCNERLDFAFDLVNFYAGDSSFICTILKRIKLKNDTINEIIKPYLHLIEILLRIRLLGMRRSPGALLLPISPVNFLLYVAFDRFDVPTYFFSALKKLFVRVYHDFAERVRVGVS